MFFSTSSLKSILMGNPMANGKLELCLSVLTSLKLCTFLISYFVGLFSKSDRNMNLYTLFIVKDNDI